MPAAVTSIISTTFSMTLLACLLVLTKPAAHAQSDDGQRMTIATLSTEHRSPARLRGDIEALMRPGDDLGIIGEHFIITTSVDNLARIRETLQGLDTPLQQLQISVDFDYQADPTAADDASGTHSATALEGERLTLRQNESGDEDDLSLSLRASYREQQLLIEYGITDIAEVEPLLQHSESLTPGQWHIFQFPPPATDLLAAPSRPIDFLVPDTQNATPPREIAIRIDVLN